MTTFNNAFIFDQPAFGASASSWGSNIFVVHEALDTNDTKSNEPHVLASSYDNSVSTTNTNSIEVIVPSSGLSLELYVITDTAVDKTIELNVFGKVPTKDGITGLDRRWPGDIDSTNFDNPTDMWIPLQNLEAVYAAREDPTSTQTKTEQCASCQIVFDADTQGPALKYDSTNEWYMSQRASMYLSGCTSIIVGVKAGNLISNGLLLGRFVG